MNYTATRLLPRQPRALIVALVAALALLVVPQAASAAQLKQPLKPAPAWFDAAFKQRVDAAGTRGVPLEDHRALDACPGVVLRERRVGTGTCLVVPFGCTANFVYYSGDDKQAPEEADGRLYLGTAGHCVEKRGEPVYGAVSTPGVGPSIARIGTVSKFVEKYDDDGLVQDFAAIRVENGFSVEPRSPVGGPEGIYEGCEAGQPLKYYGHGYEVAVAQGKPGGGVAAHWYQDGFGYFGTALGGDSGSGVLHAANDRAVGDLTAINILDSSLAFMPGEVVGTRVTWILDFLGSAYSLVNHDRSLSRDTTTTCPDQDGSSEGGGKGKGGGKGNGGGKGKGGGGKGGDKGNGKGGGKKG